MQFPKKYGTVGKMRNTKFSSDDEIFNEEWKNDFVRKMTELAAKQPKLKTVVVNPWYDKDIPLDEWGDLEEDEEATSGDGWDMDGNGVIHVDDDGLQDLESDEDFDYSEVAERFAEAMENGETIDWMLLHGDKLSRRAAKWWIAKKEVKRKKAEEKAKREAAVQAEKELLESIRSRLTPEEREFLKKKVGKL